MTHVSEKYVVRNVCPKAGVNGASYIKDNVKHYNSIPDMDIKKQSLVLA